MASSILSAQKGIRIVESLENYQLIDLGAAGPKKPTGISRIRYYTEEHFWSVILSNPDQIQRARLSFYSFALCNWVARVPGLYWTEYSAAMRLTEEKEVYARSDEWVVFRPSGKSRKVLGGIGTMLLPPDNQGQRLVSLSASNNASLGIPALISADVYQRLNCQDGDVLEINDVIWQPMNSEWSAQFASTKDIPRGYLIIDSIEQIKKIGSDQPVIMHPFSIMEYELNSALVYDFVYMTVHSGQANYRKQIERFFKEYAAADGRNGRYLINPDLITPIFESYYQRPSDLRRPSERAKVELIRKRIIGNNFTPATLNDLMQLIPLYYGDILSIKRLIKTLELNPAIFSFETAADTSSELVNYCFDHNKIDILFDRVLTENPQIIKPHL